MTWLVPVSYTHLDVYKRQTEKLALKVVVEAGSDALHSISYGDTISAWADAAEVCAATHVEYLDAPVPLSLIHI